MNFRKVNNITGWIILAIACTTYTLTREATASLWDTGEFIACANELGIPHPPGSPLFNLLGRFFILVFSGGSDANVASAVNLLSATASGFTILFLFWTITHFARKMFVNHGEALSTQQLVTVMAAGVVGALAYTFSDTFWFSAVEGEVYALSSFFTALIIWAMLKWEHAFELAKNPVEKNRADRWIVFIFFMIGLSITVHLLNLLTLPSIVMIYYYKKHTYKVGKAIFAFLIAIALTGLILLGMVNIIPKWSATFDRIFVNNFNLPFFSGFTFFYILLGILIWLGLRFAAKKGLATLRLAIWCFIFILLGYSTYVTTLIRSNANPGIDMSNVDNPMALASYFGREQYGSAPLIMGPHFAALPADKDGNGYYDYEKKSMKWAKLNNKYVELGYDMEPVYDNKDLMFFPRLWDVSGQQEHSTFYASWLNLGQYRDPQTGRVRYETPTYGDNLNWFFSYQMGLMYWRYFMWNFSGRQNDLQGFGNKRDGNWQTGISIIDQQMLGDQSKLPESLKNNKANNKLYLLPFLLGMLGCVYHFIKNRKDWLVNFLLFFFTGIAIGLYLNMPGNQPRERDYAFAGSFYAYAIWIGLAVVGFVKLVKDSKKDIMDTLIYGSLLTFIITAFSLMNFSGSVILKAGFMITAVFALFVTGITYLLKKASSNGNNIKIANFITIAVCMIVPILMANQEWNDHDRSKKTLARDNAKNYLESCAPNAILFTFGDNDTYPLWYVQEVEKVRPDIRIINTSLLGIDWYINQLRYKINKSDSMDVIWTPQQIMGQNRQYLQYAAAPNIPQESYYDLYDVMKNVLGQGDNVSTFPVKKFKVPVDSALVRKNRTVNADDVVPGDMLFEVPGNDLTRDQLIILNIIASNGWKRPIYFTSPYNELGFQHYLRKDGITYRLVPVSPDAGINADWMYNNLMTKFTNGHAATKGVYFDEENRRHLIGLRQAYAELAKDLVAKNRKEEARKIISKADSLIPGTNIPYGMPSRYEMHNQSTYLILEAAYECDAKEVAAKISKSLNADLNQQLDYYASLGDDMSRNQLDDILNRYSQMRYSAQSNEQRNQAEGYLITNLSNFQSGLSTEISRTFDFLQYVKQTEAKYLPQPKAAVDSVKPKPDTSKLKTDSAKTK
jgi:hypothetical protein